MILFIFKGFFPVSRFNYFCQLAFDKHTVPHSGNLLQTYFINYPKFGVTAKSNIDKINHTILISVIFASHPITDLFQNQLH